MRFHICFDMILIIPFLGLLGYVLATNYVLRYERAECISSGDVKIILCKAKAINRTLKSLEVDFRFQNTNDLSLKYEMFFKYGTIYKTFNVKSTDDVCGYINGTSKSVLLNNFIPALRIKHPELYSQSCPIDYFIIREFWGDVAQMNLPPLVPAGQYRVIMSLYNRKFNVTTIMLLSIKPIGANQLLMG